jgi:hypothetical protein
VYEEALLGRPAVGHMPVRRESYQEEPRTSCRVGWSKVEGCCRRRKEGDWRSAADATILCGIQVLKKHDFFPTFRYLLNKHDFFPTFRYEIIFKNSVRIACTIN